MSRVIVLDSTPLALFLQRRNYHQASECIAWVARHLNGGDRLIVPEIIDYEVRRELLRLGTGDVIIATGNVSHLSPVVRADQWDRI